MCALQIGGGRVQRDDVIAFNALNEAYRFPKESLLFMLNNVPSKRPPDYDGSFLVTISSLLPPGVVSPEKVFILENMDDTTAKIVEENRIKLFAFLFTAEPQKQKEYKEVILRVAEIKMLENKIQALLNAMEEQSSAFKNQMESLKKQYEEGEGEGEFDTKMNPKHHTTRFDYR